MSGETLAVKNRILRSSLASSSFFVVFCMFNFEIFNFLRISNARLTVLREQNKIDRIYFSLFASLLLDIPIAIGFQTTNKY